ncbi:MAG: polyprenyl synthetase family protein, partial [bacterium]
MDNADFRRGYPTVHRKFGEAEAVLAGDMLLTLAFEFVSSNKNFDSQNILAVIKKISQYSSYRYLITGQYYDIWLQKGLLPKTLQNIKITNFYKTAGLVLLSVEIPIILLNSPYWVKYNLVKYGYFLGLLFQITDDMLDNDGLAEVLSLQELKNLAKVNYEKIVNLPLNKDLKEIAKFVYTREK